MSRVCCSVWGERGSLNAGRYEDWQDFTVCKTIFRTYWRYAEGFSPAELVLEGICSISNSKIKVLSPKGFPRILDEFSAEFVPLRDLAVELRPLLFPF